MKRENEVINCLLNHKTIRKFKEDKIEEKTVNILTDVAMRAPTAGNLQNYSVIVVDDQEIIEKLPSFNCPLVIIVCADNYRMKRWMDVNNTDFYFDNIMNLFISSWDAYIALHNIDIAAKSMGLGTVYDGEALVFNAKEILNIPDYVVPVGLLCIGHPDHHPELKNRLPLDAVVHRNSYKIPTDDDVNAFYRKKDEQFENLDEETKQKFYKKGVFNQAQKITIGHYTKEINDSYEDLLFRNLRNAKYRI